jgi:hypothetical protein
MLFSTKFGVLEEVRSMNNKWSVGWIVGLAAWVPVWGAEELPVLSAEVSLPVRSAYVWRGQVINDEAVFQPELSVEKYGVGLGLWLNDNLTDNVGEAGDVDEADWTVYYTRDCGPVNATVGMTEYAYPHQSEPLLIDPEIGVISGGGSVPSTREVFVELTAAESIEWVCVPVLSLNYDFGQVDGLYGSLGVNTAIDLPGEGVSLEMAASLGLGFADYNAYYFGVDTTALNDLTAGVAAPIQLTEEIVLKPGIEYTVLVDDEIRDAADEEYGHCETWVFALALEGSF